MSNIIVIDRASLAVSGSAATLSPDGVIGTSPGHLAVTTVVVNTSVNPAPSEFWEPTATKGRHFRVTIERIS